MCATLFGLCRYSYFQAQKPFNWEDHELSGELPQFLLPKTTWCPNYFDFLLPGNVLWCLLNWNSFLSLLRRRVSQKEAKWNSPQKEGCVPCRDRWQKEIAQKSQQLLKNKRDSFPSNIFVMVALPKKTWTFCIKEGTLAEEGDLKKMTSCAWWGWGKPDFFAPSLSPSPFPHISRDGIRN